MVIPYTQFEQFMKEWHNNDNMRKHLRLGQAFFNWANLHKMNQTTWLHKLYNADNKTATIMLNDVIDPNN